MKAIKKVEVVPLDQNTGTIIDSVSTTDDKTKNTYSARVIEELGGEATFDKRLVAVSFQVTLTGDSQQISSQAIDYPTGFTAYNTYPVSCKSKATSENYFKYQQVVTALSGGNVVYGSGCNISLQQEKMYFSGRIPWASGDTVDVYVLLLRAF